MNRLFPKEIIELSQENNFHRHSVKTRVIYFVTVCFLVTLLALLPMIKLDVGIRSQGIIRPMVDIVPIQSPVSGHIRSLNVTENSSIKRGELFARIEAPELNEQIRFNKRRRQQIGGFLSDLTALLQTDSTESNSNNFIQSTRYRQSYLAYKQQLSNSKQRINRLLSVYRREQVLHDRNAVSTVSLDEARFAWQDAVGQYRLLVEQQKNRWKQDLVTFQNERDELESEYERLRQERRRYDIRSPVSGTVQNIAGIYDSSFVYHNQVLGEISPDTNLIAEVYIDPRNIGLLEEGMPVRMQIDAYNYNHWGVATGRIVSISRDIRLNGDQPHFRIQCSIDQTYLELSTGVRGELKKGMTLQARFIMARRSLLQLLYDKMDDWINPNRGNLGRTPPG